MGAILGTKKPEKDVSTKSRGRLNSIQSELMLAKPVRWEDKLVEVEDVTISLHGISSPIESWKRVEKREKDTIVSRKSLKEEGDTYPKHRLPLTTKRLGGHEYFPLSVSHEEYSSSGSSTSSRVAIKLSAEHLILRRESREVYLMNTFMEFTEYRGSRSKPVSLEFLVDLTEIELELERSYSKYSLQLHEPFNLQGRLLDFCHLDCSLVVSQTQENKVSDSTIKTFNETYEQMNKLFHLESVDVSGCTLLTQVSLLPGLLSAHGLIRSPMRIVCQFSKDFLHLEKDELMDFLKLTKILVLQGDVSKEQFQELINKLFLSDFVYNRNETVTHALIVAGADVNITDKDGRTALFYAADNEKVTHALIEAGADVNITDKDGRTALLYAVHSEKVTHALIKAGADVNITDKDGRTALLYAVHSEKVTHALIKAGADVNITDKDGRTALLHAVHSEMVTHALIKAGADVNITDKTGKTALFYAVDNEKVTHALIKAGADVNITDKTGKTALFYAVHNEKVTHALIEAGADVRIVDRCGRTVLLHILGGNGKILNNFLRRLIKVLLENGASLCETTEKEDCAFHLILNLFQHTFNSIEDKEKIRCSLLELLDILKLFSQSNESENAVNIRNINLNSPLHQWATLGLPSSNKYHENVFDGYSFSNLLKNILDELLQCRALVDDGNENKQAPLHMCRTWAAAKLLLDAGAEPDVKDASASTPLLAAAKKNTCIEKDSERFYPDVDQTPKVFWKEVLDQKLDPWTADKNGDSVLSILIQKEAKCLAKALIETACEMKLVESDAIGVPLLITSCKDKSNYKEWKVDLVKTLLKYRSSLARESLIDKDTALHFCCTNMLELPENSVKTSVHWKIAQHLILCGADVEATGKEGKSCLNIAESCPVLKELLSMPLNIEKVTPLIDSWKPASMRHQVQLDKVARGFHCQQIATVCYFKEALDNGTFGLVFVGINTQDGKEVAVKRIETMRVENKENIKQEIEDLKLGVRGDKVIQCLSCTHDKDFLYVILELMEGNLDDLLSDDYIFNINQKIKLCRDICMGLDYLHSRDIIHRGIKPSNILYQVLHSGLNLKLAFFGLRCQMYKELLTSDFTADTFESLTKERCWMAPEVLHSQSHSKSSDVFSCGLVIHYLLTNKKHPFVSGGTSKDSPLTESIETVDNIIQNKFELDETISSDAKDLVKSMLHQDEMERPNIFEIRHYQFF